MKFFGVLCIFVIVTYASAARVVQIDELNRLYERAADPEADTVAYADADPAAYADADPVAYADAYAEAYANAVANAVSKAAGLSNADPKLNAAANAVALSDVEPIALRDDDDGDDDLMRPRRFTCDVLSFETAWFSFNNTACNVKCLFLEGTGGTCQDGICICQ